MLAPYTVYARLSDALFAASSAFDVCFMYVLFRRQCTICIGHMIYHKKSHAVMLIVLKLRTALDLHFADTRTLGFVVSIAHARRVGVGRRHASCMKLVKITNITLPYLFRFSVVFLTDCSLNKIRWCWQTHVTRFEVSQVTKHGTMWYVRLHVGMV